MAVRIGPGPVFVYESLILARRRSVYVGRALFVLAILAVLSVAWWGTVNGPAGGGPLTVLARVGESFFGAMAGVQLAMVMLVAPATAAGAICDDRARGLLAQMATTDLNDAEIILGKLGSRLAPVLAMLAAALPVSALTALLGGVDFGAILGLFAVSTAVAVLGCSLSIWASLRVARAQDAFLLVLAVWTLWLLGDQIWWTVSRTYLLAPPPDWLSKANPIILAYAPYTRPGYAGPSDFAAFAAGAMLIAAALSASTIAGLRRAVLPEAVAGPPRWRSARPSRLRRWFDRLPGPSLDGNPVLWRDGRRGRSSRMAGVLWATYWTASIAVFGVATFLELRPGTRGPASGPLMVAAMIFQPSLGLLLLSVRAPASLAEERDRGTLDLLMTAPLSTRSIVAGKWLAVFRTAVAIAAMPGLVAAILACVAPVNAGRLLAMGIPPPSPTIIDLPERLATAAFVFAEVLAAGAAITSLGVLLATWLARPGRAIGMNVAAFVWIAVGWPVLFVALLWEPLAVSVFGPGRVATSDVEWLATGIVAISPAFGPIMTLAGLDAPASGHRSKFIFLVACWCVLASAFAAAAYRATVATFDERLGRMPGDRRCDDDYID